jgi:hypothetical protein
LHDLYYSTILHQPKKRNTNQMIKNKNKYANMAT